MAEWQEWLPVLVYYWRNWGYKITVSERELKAVHPCGWRVHRARAGSRYHGDVGLMCNSMNATYRFKAKPVFIDPRRK